MDLLQMSLAGAVIIFVLVIFRSLAIYRVPKKIFVVLWMAVLVRLLVPYSLPSAFSVYSLAGRIYRAALSEKTEKPGGTGISAVDGSGGFWQENSEDAEFSYELPLPEVADGLCWQEIVWLLGMLGFAVFFAAVYLNCLRKFQSSLPVQKEFVTGWLERHRLRRNLSVRCSDRIRAPLTYGIFRPVILLPKAADWENEEGLNFILLHEYVHICHWDAAIKLFLTAALCVHWFNPAVWLMYILANRDIELSCDEAVVCRLGGAAKKEYAMVLFRMEEARSAFTPFCNNFSKTAIEERIAAILHRKKTSVFDRVLLGFLVVALSLLFFTTAKPEAGETASGEKEFNLEIKEDLDMGMDMDYSYLLEKMFGISGSAGTGTGFGGTIKVSDLSSPSVVKQLRAAGIDTNSAQYKAVVGNMMKANKGGMAYCNIQGIKNQMRLYNSDGDFTAGGLVVPGMDATGIPEAERHQIIEISEEARQKMFDNCKREFIAEYGVANGDTTKRSDVFREFQLSIKKEDRLKGTWTLGQYERQYNLAMYEAVKAANPDWKPGQPFDASILDNVTRESVDSTLVKSGNTLVKSTAVSGSKIDLRM